LPLPSGAATSSNQTNGSQLSQIVDPGGVNKVAVGSSGNILISGLAAVGATPVLNPISVSGVDGAGNKQHLKQITGTNALVVDGSAVTQPVSASSLPLPTGAATSANQTTANASLSSIDSKLTSPLTVTGPLTDTQLRASAVPVSGTVTANAGTGTFAVSAASLPLPTGAATETTLSSLNTKVPSNLTVTSTRLLVDGSGVTQPVSGTVSVGNTQRSKVNLARNDYGSVNVTTGAYVQLIASTSAQATMLEIFDSSGQTLVLAVGAAASEVDQFYINPGGNGQVQLLIPASSRVSIKAVTASATAGYINLNLYS
jgi:hypothetical protein